MARKSGPPRLYRTEESFARGRARDLGGPDAVTPAPGHDNLACGARELNVLAAVDVEFGAGDVARLFCTEIIDRLRDFLRQAEAAERNPLDDLFCSRREDGGVDLARCDRIDAHAERTEIRRHLARQ